MCLPAVSEPGLRGHPAVDLVIPGDAQLLPRTDLASRGPVAKMVSLKPTNDPAAPARVEPAPAGWEQPEWFGTPRVGALVLNLSFCIAKS